jgi:hypothetical protein
MSYVLTSDLLSDEKDIWFERTWLDMLKNQIAWTLQLIIS